MTSIAVIYTILYIGYMSVVMEETSDLRMNITTLLSTVVFIGLWSLVAYA